MEYLLLPGGEALTSSASRKIQERIENSGGRNIKSIRAVWVYYIRLRSAVSGNTESKLRDLLPGASDLTRSVLPEIGPGAQLYYVTPRNISPWSSKATSIASVCGLREEIHRIERGRIIILQFSELFTGSDIAWRHLLYDRMTENIGNSEPDVEKMFLEGSPIPLEVIDIFADGLHPVQVLKEYNTQRGLAMDQLEIEYLVQVYTQLERPPFDIELFMFAQVNSEHCRHKQFNANWTIDGINAGKTLFEMIKDTHTRSPEYTISAYSDNAAVLEGNSACFWAPDYSTGSWKATKEMVHYLIKVETHNHPTAISPFPGAATGSGGEIRDEGAVGRGSTPKAGLCGFWVSNLLIPDHRQTWEIDVGEPAHYASSLDIMLEAPIGSARFNNEFGRPCISGCFRALLTDVDIKSPSQRYRGYHKPIMIAGGLGAVRPQHALKRKSAVKPGAHVIVLGGPAMLIGLGGGAASSNTSGEDSIELDFASVQRDNPEMERRAQMVINACIALDDGNPIAMIHDVGAGGLSNALPELVKDAGYGGTFELRQIESADSSMSPLQIWCCEAQERYVLLINEEGMNRFQNIANRERCGFSDVGRVTGQDCYGETHLVLTDRESVEYPKPIDLPMSILFPKDRQLERIIQSRKPELIAFDCYQEIKTHYTRNGALSDLELFIKTVETVLKMPAVGSKSFLITIGDRTVGGLTTRDQMVGPWQTPVADVGVTATALCMSGGSKMTGEALCMGEKPPIALISPGASARMAVAESLLNLAAADIQDGLSRVRLSANWMAAVNEPGEGAALHEAVKDISKMCSRLGISIPVGKDSTSMKASWKDQKSQESKMVVAPLTVVVSAFAPVQNVRNTWTPTLRRYEDVGETILLFVDLAQGRQAMGGSALAQAMGQIGNEAPDVLDVDLISDYFDAVSQLHESGIVLAYHDRSDGGLFTTLAEMMFAGRCGAEIMLDGVSKSDHLSDILTALFNEELGAIFQVRKSDEINFARCFATCGPPPGLIRKIGRVPAVSKQKLTIRYGQKSIFGLDRSEMQNWWSFTSYQMQRIRDNPDSVDSEFSMISDNRDPGLSFRLNFDPQENILPLTATLISPFVKAPRVAILREQGVNGHAEMAFAFKAAGFDPIDIHMSDVISGRSLADFVGLAACGGFSYGDVLGAGSGWKSSILGKARVEFQKFFERKDTFTLGVCNGCQMLTQITEIIPGTHHWPRFVQNESEQFEARVSMVQIRDNARIPSVFFHGMSGSSLPIVVSHGEGRASFSRSSDLQALNEAQMVPIRYVDNYGKVTTRYPANPNGSPEGIAGVRSSDGRVLALMPHPERTILPDVGSYIPKDLVEEWGEFGPWVRMFKSARRWVG